MTADLEERLTQAVDYAVREYMSKDVTSAIRGVETRLETLDGHVRSLEGAVQPMALAIERVEAAANAMVTQTGVALALHGRLSDLEAKVEKLPNPRVSASNLDAQALQQQIENSHAQHQGSIEGMKTMFSRLQEIVGVSPNPVLGIKGSGLWLEVVKLQRLILMTSLGAIMVGKGAEVLISHFLSR